MVMAYTWRQITVFDISLPSPINNMNKRIHVFQANLTISVVAFHERIKKYQILKIKF